MKAGFWHTQAAYPNYYFAIWYLTANLCMVKPEF